MKCRCRYKVLPAVALALVCAGCAQSRKLAEIRGRELGVDLQLPAKNTPPKLDSTRRAPVHDTIRITGLDGREMLIMKAIRDDETGDMVATEELDAAYVVARFRNVAERHGKIDLEFQVIVPQELHDSHWQLRFHPEMYVLGDSLRLDDVVITGTEYRRAQLQGLRQYERYASRIVTDSMEFVDRRSLGIFLARNTRDSECEAEYHYTNHLAKYLNGLRMSRRPEMWRKYVKVPIVTEGIRLDTVMKDINGKCFIYNYVQTINTRPKLRKVDVTLSGAIFESDRRLYTIPVSEPLSFYVSSLNAFADGTERYKTQIVHRAVSANASAEIAFRAGRAEIEESLSDNRREIGFIKSKLRLLANNEEFDLDSIIITSFASPEGSVASNASLTYRRARSASDYFSGYLRQLRDSMRREEGFFVSVGDDLSEGNMRRAAMGPETIRFLSRSGGENWPALDALVLADTVLTDSEKDEYLLLSQNPDLDARERDILRSRFQSRLYSVMYPKLRSVRFDFHLHRKGMVKDTVHTNVLDTTYMDGVQAIRDHDYELALELLAPYQDFNTAVAYLAMDRNRSALSILKDCPKDARVNYMLALVYQRLGEERDAVECYVRSCEQDPSYVYRGNLDPEISELIRKYNINDDDDEI
ncbi:MAG: hypothetical protein Q4F39_05625 [Bacteroidia bacterium]|nr:hypothetical protein [Bacteroidia bacterium]